MDYETKRNALLAEAKKLLADGKTAEANAKAKEIEALDAQHEEAVKAEANIAALAGTATHKPITASAVAPAGLVAGATSAPETKDVFATAEYEKAFMDFACRGTAIPERFHNSDETTTTSTASAVIPTTLVKEIITEMKAYGELYAGARKLNIPGGVDVPILSLKPTASWISESGDSDSNKLQANTKVTFSYYGLECKIAQTILSNVTSIEEFNALFVPLATEAIIKALEIAMISGDGSGKMLGVLSDNRIANTQKIELTDTEVASWADWKKKVFAKMKKAYRNGVFIMAQGTFDGYIDAMTDAQGQPIGRVNYGIDGAEKYRFGGKQVITVEDDIIASYDNVEAGNAFAIFMKLSDYAINTNMQLKTVKWTDNDTNEVKNKLLLVCDGKLLDTNGVLIIKRKA